MFKVIYTLQDGTKKGFIHKDKFKEVIKTVTPGKPCSFFCCECPYYSPTEYCSTLKGFSFNEVINFEIIDLPEKKPTERELFFEKVKGKKIRLAWWKNDAYITAYDLDNNIFYCVDEVGKKFIYSKEELDGWEFYKEPIEKEKPIELIFNKPFTFEGKEYMLKRSVSNTDPSSIPLELFAVELKKVQQISICKYCIKLDVCNLYHKTKEMLECKYFYKG